MIIGDPREDKIEKTWGSEIMLEKSMDGQENMGLGGKQKLLSKSKKEIPLLLSMSLE